MNIINDYDRIWAIRYLREAFAEYHNGSRTQDQNDERSLMAMAVRKAQLALQHAFGSPEYLELLIADAIQTRTTIEDPMLGLLSTLSLVAKNISEPQMLWSKGSILRVTKEILEGVSTIIREMTSTKNIEAVVD